MEMLTWEEIEYLAARAFVTWSDHRWQIRWARRSWNILTKAGLTSYESDLGRCAAVFRLVALAQLHSDFSDIAWEEPVNCDSITDIPHELDVEPFYAGQLAGDEPDLEFDSDGIRFIARKYRHEVLSALLHGYGDETALFVSLWRTYPEDHFASTNEIVNSISTEKMAAYGWVTAGCPSL